MGYIVSKYQVLYVNIASFESGGSFWPLVFGRMVVGILVGQLTMVGVFLLKGGYYQSTVLLPLVCYNW